MWKKPRLVAIACLVSVWSLPAAVTATTISTGSASPAVGPVLCQSGFGPPQCNHQAFDTTGDLAYSGGPAAPAVVSSTINPAAFSAIHDPTFVNDGFYGNGRSWIGDSVNAWLKIDLGLVRTITQIKFGRDRLAGGFDDRDPGQFQIDVALSDTIFANGNATDDATEYSNVVNSSALGFSGTISLDETVVVDFGISPVTARYIKMTFASFGAAIDEVEVFGVPEPATLVLFGLGLLGLGGTRRSRRT